MSTVIDWKTCRDDRERYSLYLCSREWSEKKEGVRERAGGICERCHVNEMDAVHHLTYARKYEERLEDLQAICRDCHEYTHGKADVDPARVSFSEVVEFYDLLVEKGIDLELRGDHVEPCDMEHAKSVLDGGRFPRKARRVRKLLKGMLLLQPDLFRGLSK